VATDAPNSLAIADLDRDGDLDLVTANFFGSVTVVRNDTVLGGVLSFLSPVTYSTGGNPSYALPLDIDNNGSLDLAIANASFSIPDDKPLIVLSNNGDGNYSISDIGRFGGIGKDAQDVASGDFDADGDLDLVFTDINKDIVSVVFNVTPISKLGGAVVGLSPQQIICNNLTTGQRVTVRSPLRAWDCKASGLTVNTGDRVRFTITGVAE
jgi:hypothetical protein